MIPETRYAVFLPAFRLLLQIVSKNDLKLPSSTRKNSTLPLMIFCFLI